MIEIKFKYRDQYSKDNKWSTQSCVCRSVEECKRFYGLGIDPNCEYEIISVREVGGKEIDS